MEWVELGKAFTVIRNGKSIKQSGTEGYPITRIETIADRYINEDKVGYASINNLEQYNDYILKKGDILMSHINSVKHLAKTAIFNSEITLIHGMNLLCLRTNKNKVNPYYAFYYLNSDLFLNQIPQITKNSVNQASFNITNLKLLKIPVPPINIQKQIVEILDKSQRLIDNRKAQIELLDDLIESVFYDMFGDPVTNSKNIEQLPLGELCNLKAGKFIKAKEISSFYENNKYPCYGGNGIRGYVREYTHDISSVLIGRQGALCGNVKLVEGKFYATEHAIVTRSSVELDINWLYLMLRKMNLNRLATGAAQPGLNVGKLVELDVIYPSINQQIKFSNKFKAIENQKQQMQESLRLMEDNYNSLMQQAFKGELF